MTYSDYLFSKREICFTRNCGNNSMFKQMIMMLIFFMLSTILVNAQAPSHDPSTMIRNTDGRYWIFTTGDGVWCMSSSNADFTDWRAESTPFSRNSYPSWINSAVPGFAGTFWAPDVIQMNGYYYLYYSCSTFGSSRSAIGVARSSNLSGGWTDLGMVVSSNGSNDINAIDPGMFRDTDGRVWMTYGSFFGGIAVVEINPSTGKTIGGLTHLTGGNHTDIEAPYITKNGNYYYLYINRGSCCNGVQSTYYVRVGRSTSVTGPYTDWRTILGNDGRYIGPGHIGYGEGRLTYHYYDGQDNGAAKLYVTTLGYSNGWPVIGGTGGGDVELVPGVYGLNGTYQLQNRGTGLVIDGYGNTGDGDPVNQYDAATTHPNSHWQLVDVGSSEGAFYYLQNVGTGMKIDGYGRTSNGEDIAQYNNSTTHINAQWVFQQYNGYYRIQNRGTGLFMDGMGRTANGDAVGQYANTTHVNAQWELVSINGNQGGSFDGNVVQLVNRGSGQVVDGYGLTTNGDACNQYDGSTTHPNSHWEMVNAGDSYYYFVNIGTNMKLDGMGRTGNGDDIGQYANTTHVNAQWGVEQFDGNYYRIVNRGSGLFMDGMGRTTNGEPVGQYANTTHVNAQWEIRIISSMRSAQSFAESNINNESVINLYPNPVVDILNIDVPKELEGNQIVIYNNVGQVVYIKNNVRLTEQLDLSDFNKGIYSVVIANDKQVVSNRFVKQ